MSKQANAGSLILGRKAFLGSKSKETNEKSVLREQPCNDYTESHSMPGFCQQCGHSEASHENSQKQMKQEKPKVITSGGVSRIASADSLKAKLDPKFYILEVNMQGYYLTEAEPFELPKKVYGSAHDRSQRILKTYGSRGNKSMGVMCSGRPGTGKTVLSKLTANLACKAGMPVIIIRQGFFGPPMSSFLEHLPNRCLMFVDEIEKVYESDEARNWLLSVLDGTVISSHLWLSTCNDPNIGMAFESRPGRIRYHYKFDNMEPELIAGMIGENIRNAVMRKAVLETAEKIHNLTPDILFSIIEECLIHNEKPSEFMEFLNVDTSIPEAFGMKGFVRIYKMTPRNIHTLEKMAETGNEAEKRFADYVTRYSFGDAVENFSEKFAQMFEKSLVPVESYWVHNPISFDRMGKLELDMSFDLDKERITIEWDAEDIRKTEFRNGAITIHGPEKGEIVYLRPTRLGGRKGMMAI